MDWRHVIAYGLLAMLIVFGLGGALYYTRQRKERRRIKAGGRPRNRRRH